MVGRGRARVYIDGFNLYYGALKGTREKWLNLEEWAGTLLPGYTVDRIVYCTARVRPRPDSPDAHVRQDAYLRALRSLTTVEVLEGQFKVKAASMLRIPLPTCDCCTRSRQACACCHGTFVKVEKTEEKGSDVNVAVQLVADGFRDRYDTALVVSNDSDIQPAVDIVRATLAKRVVIADPRNNKHPALHGDERRQVRRRGLERAQFPNSVLDAGGRVITRPRSWE